MKDIILIAPPGGGKGTLAKKLASDKSFIHISTGDLLREKAKNDEEINKLITEGKLVSDEIVIKLLKEKLLNTEGPVIFDGFPRTKMQAELLDTLLDEINRNNYLVVEIVIPKEEVKRRITGRRLCPSCGAIYNIYSEEFRPREEGVCNACPEKLIQRADDNEETFEKRYQKYLEEASSILDYYGEDVYKLDGLLDINKRINLVREASND